MANFVTRMHEELCAAKPQGRFEKFCSGCAGPNSCCHAMTVYLRIRRRDSNQLSIIVKFSPPNNVIGSVVTLGRKHHKALVASSTAMRIALMNLPFR